MKGNLEEAEKDLSKVIKLDVDKDIKVNALIKIAILKMSNNDNSIKGIKTALKYFDEALQVDPNNPDVYIHRARMNLVANNANEVINDLDKCIELIPNFPHALSQKTWLMWKMAFTLNDKKNIEAALAEFNKLAECFPNNSDVHSHHALVLTFMQDYKAADESYIKAIECDPEDATLYVKRGLLLINSKSNPEKGIKLIKKALTVDNRCSAAYEMLGNFEIENGNLKKGFEYLDEAIKWSYDEQDISRIFSSQQSAKAHANASQMLDLPLMPRKSFIEL